MSDIRSLNSEILLKLSSRLKEMRCMFWFGTMNLWILICLVLVTSLGIQGSATEQNVTSTKEASESRAIQHTMALAFPNESGYIRWDPIEYKLSARTQDVPIKEFLIYLKTLTKWDIFIQPGLKGTITTEIENLKPKEAIRAIPWGATFTLKTRGHKFIQLKIFKGRASNASQEVDPLEIAELSGEYSVEKIGNEIIVRLKDNSDIDINKVAEKLGAKILESIPEINAYRLQLGDETATQLAKKVLEKNNGIGSVEDNFKYSRPSNSQRGYAINPSKPKITSAPGLSDDSVIIGMIDTAISNSDKTSEFSDFLLPTLSIAGETNGPSDSLTHGSTMFQTIMQGLEATANSAEQVFDVKVLPVDVYGQEDQTNTFLIARATVQAIENGADIINLSLGGPEPSSILQDVINQGADKGVVFVAAAGNRPDTAYTFPAAYENVLAVTSVMNDGSIAPFANRGDFIDAAAPYGAMVEHNDQKYFSSGTSISTAYISGITAGLASESGIQPKIVEERVRNDFKP